MNHFINLTDYYSFAIVLAQLKIIVLIKEAIKLAFLRLVQYLEHQEMLGMSTGSKWPEKNSFFLFVVRTYLTMLCSIPFIEQHKLVPNQNRKSTTGKQGHFQAFWTMVHIMPKNTHTFKSIYHLELFYIFLVLQYLFPIDWRLNSLHCDLKLDKTKK